MDTIRGRRVLGSTRLIRTVLSDLQLNRPAKLCYLLMLGYGRDSGVCWASESTLAQGLRSSQDQVRRYLRQLSGAGFIRAEYIPGKTTRYTFLWHPSFAAAISTPLASMQGVPLASMQGPPGMDARGSIGIKKGKISQQVSSSVEGPPLPPGGERRSGEAATTTPQTLKQIKAEIWGYYHGERKHPVKEPDPDIVRRCATALCGHSIDELRAVLRDRFRSGYAPGQPSGPRSYAWFVRVIENAFRP